MTYPLWSYFPRNVRAPEWVAELIGVVAGVEASIRTVEGRVGLKSDEVLAELRSGLLLAGYEVESGKTASEKIRRPVLFGENGRAEVNYEIDAFHDALGIAVEVEAGRGGASHADYRDIVRTSLILDANSLVLLMPTFYKGNSSKPYSKTRDQLDAIYASDRLKLPFSGILLVGY